jgi:hypothetical protein
LHALKIFIDFLVGVGFTLRRKLCPHQLKELQGRWKSLTDHEDGRGKREHVKRRAGSSWRLQTTRRQQGRRGHQLQPQSQIAKGQSP